MVEMVIDNVERQTNYVKKQKAKGNGLGLVFADAFLRGMRDIGYKSPAWALAEEVDNSWQAGATTVSIRFGFDPANQSQGKTGHASHLRRWQRPDPGYDQLRRSLGWNRSRR